MPILAKSHTSPQHLLRLNNSVTSLQSSVWRSNHGPSFHFPTLADTQLLRGWQPNTSCFYALVDVINDVMDYIKYKLNPMQVEILTSVCFTFEIQQQCKRLSQSREKR